MNSTPRVRKHRKKYSYLAPIQFWVRRKHKKKAVDLIKPIIKELNNQ